MKYFTHTTALMLVTTVLAAAGCGGGGSSSGDGGTSVTPSPPVTPPPTPSPIGTDFTVFTRDLMVSTANDTDEPVELESIEWVFSDDENEVAYDDIVTASGP